MGANRDRVDNASALPSSSTTDSAPALPCVSTPRHGGSIPGEPSPSPISRNSRWIQLHAWQGHKHGGMSGFLHPRSIATPDSGHGFIRRSLQIAHGRSFESGRPRRRADTSTTPSRGAVAPHIAANGYRFEVARRGRTGPRGGDIIGSHELDENQGDWRRCRRRGAFRERRARNLGRRQDLPDGAQRRRKVHLPRDTRRSPRTGHRAPGAAVRTRGRLSPPGASRFPGRPCGRHRGVGLPGCGRGRRRGLGP